MGQAECVCIDIFAVSMLMVLLLKLAIYIMCDSITLLLAAGSLAEST